MAFDVAASSIPSCSASASIVVAPGVAISFGASSAPGSSAGARNASRDLEVGCVVAVLARDERVLARSRRREEVDRLLPAHHPGLRLDLRELEARALEDAVVGALVLAEGDFQPGLVAVERVPVLHDELAQPQEPAARARLVPLLDREVVKELRELAVARDLLRMERHRLLVRHREDVLAPLAVLEPEELGDVVAARLLPELERRQHRHEHLLAPDRVHLLADDLDDLLVHAPAQRQERPDARADLPDVAAAHEQLVRDRLRVRRRLAQRRDEELRLPRDHDRGG